MLFTVWLFRIIVALWLFGILFIVISKIIQSTDARKKLDWNIFFLFPILIWTKKGRKKIKESI